MTTSQMTASGLGWVPLLVVENEPHCKHSRRCILSGSGNSLRAGGHSNDSDTNRKEQITMSSAELQHQALSNAVNGQSLANYPAIFQGFMARGIPENEIRPRENVFSFNAWKALGRHVRKGEHGVKIATVLHKTRKNRDTKEDETYSVPWSVTVFHISQTDANEPNGGQQ